MLYLLPLLERRRPFDVGRAGDDASRRRRLSSGRTPRHAADHRLPELTPALILDRRLHCIGIALDHPQIGSGNIFGLTPPLLPVSQGPQVEHELPSELGLAEAYALARGGQRLRPETTGQVLVGERLCVRIVACCPLDFLIGHPPQPVSIGPAFRFAGLARVCNVYAALSRRLALLTLIIRQVSQPRIV